MQNETQTEENVTVPEVINVKPIINKDPVGNLYRYFQIENGEFSGIIFTITEIYMGVTEESVDENDIKVTGRILFEETKEFTTSQLLNSAEFGKIATDVFNAIIKAMQEEELKEE